MKTILIATHNPAKLNELQKGTHTFTEKGYTIVSLNDVQISVEPEETGKTFKENSILKATYYASLSNLPTIADDGGLTINALNDEPGIHSKRWLGRDATDEELIQYTLTRLKNISPDKRTAYMQTTLTFYDPKTKHTITEYEKVKGHIVDKINPHFSPGYPYRAILIIDAFNKYYDELTEDEHAQVNHRMIALQRLIRKIENYLLQLEKC